MNAEKLKQKFEERQKRKPVKKVESPPKEKESYFKQKK